MAISLTTPSIKEQRNIYNNRQNNNESVKSVKFTGLMDNATVALRFFDTNQAIGANCIDLCSMVIPRTTIDFRDRGPDAGMETLRRESMGTINHSSVGLYGTLAGFAIATGFNNKFGIKAHKIFADNHTIDIIAQSWHEAQHSNAQDPLKQHIKTFVDKIKVFNPDLDKEKGYVSIAAEDKEAIVNAFYNKMKNSDGLTIDKSFANTMHAMITAATGGEKNVVLVSNDGKEAGNTLKTLISNFYNLTKAFSGEKAVETFKNASDIGANELVKSLKNMNLKRSIGGLGIATAIGMSTQPINMYLTKKKTGSDGFVGVEGRQKDTSVQFKIMKGFGALVFAAGALATITTKPSKLLSKIQFQGMLPTIDQLKLVYGMTIASRLLAARDKDELRESAVKDSLGFLNLLVIGSMVTKYAAKALDKTLINEVETKGKGLFAKMASSTLKTRDEVVLPLLKKNGIEIVKDGKAVSFSKLLASIKNLNKEDQKIIKSKMLVLGFAQIVGYLYSALILGMGIPRLNIYMTNKSEEKRKARIAAEKALAAQHVETSQPQIQNVEVPKKNNETYQRMISDDNISFLKSRM